MEQVLLAMDDSPEARRASRFVERFFDPRAFHVTAVHVAPPLADGLPAVPYGTIYGWPWPQADPRIQRARDRAREERNRRTASVLAREAPAGAAIDVTTGDPVDAVLRVADAQDAAVIVVGGRHRSWLDRWRSPSVSERLLRRSTRPVLVVP